MMVLVYATVLIWIYVLDKRKRRRAIILTVVSLPLTTLLMFGVLIIGASRDYAIAGWGLSPNMAVLSAEVVAVIAEAALLFILNRKSLSVAQAGVISLTMNLASFLVGQVVF